MQRSDIHYTDPSIFPLERGETGICKTHSFFQNGHSSRLFWKYTFSFPQANVSSRRRNPLLPACRVTGSFSTASAVPTGGRATDVPCVALPTDKHGASSEEFPHCRSEGVISFSLFKDLKTFPQSLVIAKNSKKQEMPQTLCQLQIFLA